LRRLLPIPRSSFGGTD